ncbi:MAG: hypothetical protein HGB21_10000 [Nitrospirae bacterium]|nr:hypothetical protein [Nitrospirota bacterium]NTW66621.1 hypothetical protein [Nitrospirota bacterium]
MKEQRTDIGCKCLACLGSESVRDKSLPAYRTEPGRGLTILHLVLHASLPLLGVFLIGCSWLALVPLFGFAAAYLANSLILCPSCAYHHAGVRFCGCYPKSVFLHRQYLGKRWGLRENLLGRSAVLLFTLGPSIAVLAARGSGNGVVVLLFLAVVILFLTSMFSCPACRQREVCALGRLTAAGIKRKDI